MKLKLFTFIFSLSFIINNPCDSSSKSFLAPVGISEHTGIVFPGSDDSELQSEDEEDDKIPDTKTFQRIIKALEKEIPVLSDDSSASAIRLFFLKNNLHVFIYTYVTGSYHISISNLKEKGKDFLDFKFSIGYVPDNERLENKKLFHAKLIKSLETLRRKHAMVNEFLVLIERDRQFAIKMANIKRRYKQQVVTDEDDRVKILQNLNHLLDIKLEEQTHEQMNQIQTLLAKLGYEPIYDAKKYPLDETPNIPPDMNTYKIKQGDVVYIQYLVHPRDSEDEIKNEYSGTIRSVPEPWGHDLYIILTDGTKIHINHVSEIIVDGGKGGHYIGPPSGNAIDFLTGGPIKRKDFKGIIPEDRIDKEPGKYDLDKNEYVNWIGIDLDKPVKIITSKKVTKKSARSWMVGEKVVVLEAPSEQNNGGFMCKRANGTFGDHDWVDINRVYWLGVDSEIAQLRTHMFQKGDSVILRIGNKPKTGIVKDFYTQPFIGRRMVVKLDMPADAMKPYVHVKFVNQMEGSLINTKNEMGRDFIESGFNQIYHILKDLFYDSEQWPSTVIGLWNKFEAFYDSVFGEDGLFYSADFDYEIINIGLKTVKQLLLEIIKHLPPSEEAASTGEENEINKALREIQFGINLFAGMSMTDTGTIPWVVKADDFERIAEGIPAKSDFTVAALLKYFLKPQYKLEDRLYLAYKIASARERLSLVNALEKIYEKKDKIEGLTARALKIVADEYTEKLTDPDEINVIYLILNLQPKQVELHNFSDVIKEAH